MSRLKDNGAQVPFLILLAFRSRVEERFQNGIDQSDITSDRTLELLLVCLRWLSIATDWFEEKRAEISPFCESLFKDLG